MEGDAGIPPQGVAAQIVKSIPHVSNHGINCIMTVGNDEE